MERLGSLPPRVSVTRWEKESSPVIHSRTALQLLPSIRRRNYYITDVVVAASSAAAFDAATTTSNQPTLLSRTDARAAGRISPPTLPEICVVVFVVVILVYEKQVKLYETQHFGSELLLFSCCSLWGAAASLR